jgi:hypothetical protein
MMDQRHPYSANLCDRLERMAWGLLASNLLASKPKLANHAIAVLPVFAWGHTNRDTGRKSNSPTGELLFPVRIQWKSCEGPVIVLHAHESLSLLWEAVGSNDVGQHGRTEIVPTDGAASGVDVGMTSVPHVIHAPILSGIQARRTLDDLASDGRSARWEILHIFENNLRWNFERALRSVNVELGLDSMPAIDRAASETIQNNILLGDDGRSDSLALRLINRCLEGEVFSRVDPERYVRRALFSGSESAIRRYIGDPHIGRKVRKVSDQIQSDDVNLITEEFSRQNPNAKLGSNRAKAALSATRRVKSATPAFSYGTLIENNDSAQADR